MWGVITLRMRFTYCNGERDLTALDEKVRTEGYYLKCSYLYECLPLSKCLLIFLGISVGTQGAA